MGTTKEDIRGWLKAGIEKGATHVIVVVDTFDYEDYPVYVMPGEYADAKVSEYRRKEMQRVMECYCLGMDIEKQLAEHRAFHTDNVRVHSSAVEPPAHNRSVVGSNPPAPTKEEEKEEMAEEKTDDGVGMTSEEWSKRVMSMDCVTSVRFAMALAAFCGEMDWSARRAMLAHALAVSERAIDQAISDMMKAGLAVENWVN